MCFCIGLISTENQVNHQVKQKCVKIGILKKSFRVQNKFFLLWMNAYSVFNRFHMFYEKTSQISMTKSLTTVFILTSIHLDNLFHCFKPTIIMHIILANKTLHTFVQFSERKGKRERFQNIDFVIRITLQKSSLNFSATILHR